MKPILTPMLQGRRRSLTESEQRILSTWVIKTLLVFQYTFRPPRVSPRMFRNLFDRQGPPDESNVWLARYFGPRIAQFYNQPLASQDPGDTRPDCVDGYGSTLVIGQLTAQAFGYVLDAHAVVREAPVLANHEIRICPSSPTITWPPPSAFDDDGLVAYQRVFGRRASLWSAS